MPIAPKISADVSPDTLNGAPRLIKQEADRNTRKQLKARRPKKVWIDLENSPHVPFFKPIIQELEKRGYSVVLTARDCFQVCELADLFGLEYRRIGHHYGKHFLAKLTGLLIRATQLGSFALREKPDLSLSHGSRSQFVLSTILRIPTLLIFDYEHAHWVRAVTPSWVMTPQLISDDAAVSTIGIKKERILKYPGIKEDVYAPNFCPNPDVRKQLGLDGHELVVTIRPPATEAHYHNPESEQLLDAVFEEITNRPDTKAVLLPRTEKQGTELRRRWPELFSTRKVFIPEHVVNGLDLIWLSDLVISGGGTMNREAAALGVPVYSIFRGRIGAVDRYLAEAGRLVLLESPEDVHRKVVFARRTSSTKPNIGTLPALNTVVSHIVSVLQAAKESPARFPIQA